MSQVNLSLRGWRKTERGGGEGEKRERGEKGRRFHFIFFQFDADSFCGNYAEEQIVEITNRLRNVEMASVRSIV